MNEWTSKRASERMRKYLSRNTKKIIEIFSVAVGWRWVALFVVHLTIQMIKNENKKKVLNVIMLKEFKNRCIKIQINWCVVIQRKSSFCYLSLYCKTFRNLMPFIWGEMGQSTKKGERTLKGQPVKFELNKNSDLFFFHKIHLEFVVVVVVL